jgi:hypothetical protein
MRFPRVVDIAGLEQNAMDANAIDKQMHELIQDVRFAITKDTKLSKDSREIRSMLVDVLRQFQMTHGTMRILFRHAYRKKDYPVIADTASLVREQIEKIYVLVTLLPEPKKWIDQYLRNAWQKDYLRFLMRQDEFGKIPRYDDHINKEYPAFLEQQRCPPPRGRRGKSKCLVTLFAKRCVKHNYDYPEDTAPPWFRLPKGDKRKFKRFLRDYFYFPMPSDSQKSIKADASYYMFLDRWYFEYKYFSGYSHIHMDKLILQHFSQYKSVEAAKRQQIYGERKAEEFMITSNTVAATLCTLIVPRLSNSFGTEGQTKEFWGELCKYSLLPKAL